MSFSLCYSAASKGVFIIALFAISACSFNDSLEPASRAELAKQRGIANPATEVEIEPFSSVEKKEELSARQDLPVEFGAELTWDIPSDPVEAFIIYYGSSPDNLKTETRVKIEELRIIEGTKYRYLLSPLNSGEALYISLAAENKGVVSERSPVQKIEREALRSESRSQMAPRFLSE